MKILRLSTNIQVIDDWQELSAQEQQAYEQALAVREKAYTPYSNFKVGACVLLENGETVVGCNQENASFPAGLCAERVAVFAAGAQYPDFPIKLIAISIQGGNGIIEPAAPCGNCRQVIGEFESKQDKPIPLLLGVDKSKFYKVASALELLPLSFHSGYLEGKK